MKTLLQIVQAACDESGIINRPDSVYGNSDPEVRQLLALANLEGRELSAQEGWLGHWPQLIRWHTFTLQEGIDTYAAPSDLGFYINNTVWDTGTDWQLDGPVTSQEWAFLIAGSANTTGPRMRFRVIGTGQPDYLNGMFHVVPNPSSTDAGRNVVVLYSSKWWANGGEDDMPQEEWLSDGDTPVLPDECFIAGLKWRFKQ